jgi:hypothetical protein
MTTFVGDEGMLILVTVLQWLLGLVTLVCFVMVLIKMFQSGEQTMGIVCIVLVFCGIGAIIAFVYGWINATKWNIKNVMLIWTGAWIAGVILIPIAFATGAAAFPGLK